MTQWQHHGKTNFLILFYFSKVGNFYIKQALDHGLRISGSERRYKNLASAVSGCRCHLGRFNPYLKAPVVVENF